MSVVAGTDDDREDGADRSPQGTRAPAGGRYSGRSGASSGGEPSRPDVVQGLTVVVVAVWCISALAIGMNTADSVWEWLPIFAFGGAAPALFLWQASRESAPRFERPSSPMPKDKESELLRALAERGELTVITTAMRTSLTADEATAMLEDLARKGYLRPRSEAGFVTYALRESDRRGLPSPASTRPGPRGGETAQPLDEDLSERETEVLALLASGMTNSEIAGELHVAVGTIKSHMNSIYRKLGANRRSEALARARELHLVT